MSFKSSHQLGFTMIELMITITLVAVLASLAVPSMRTYALNNRLTSTSQELLRTLQTARSEATKRQSNVAVCGSANPTAGTPTCTTNNIAGWIVFTDTDNDLAHGTGEAVLEVHTIDESKLSLLADGNTVSYAATGFANPGSANAIVICDSRGNVDSNGGTTQATSVARGIVIAATGRARVTSVRDSSTDSTDIADLLDATGGSCT